MNGYIALPVALALLAASGVAHANSFDSMAHAQAMNDIAATPPWPDEGYDDYYYDDPPSYSAGEWQDWSENIASENAEAELAAMASDPRFKAFLEGEWLHAGRGGEFCSAVFMRQGVGAIVAALGDKNDPAIFMFFSLDIPAPAKTRTIRATLSQTDSAPATVEVFNAALPWDGAFGTVVFAVPTAADALGGMLDQQAFAVGIDGATVAEIAWTGGRKARSSLQDCLKQR